MMIRRTKVTPVIPSRPLSLQSNDRLRHQAILLFDVAALAEIENERGTPHGSIHCFHSSDRTTSELKTELLKRGAWLIETRVGASSFLSVTWRRNAACETLHRRLRTYSQVSD